MKTVILAGGTGRRVFPLAVNKPKPMFKILGKPLIEYVIKTWKEAGLKDLVVVVGHNGKQIRDHLGDGNQFGVDIEYTIQEKARGMADALKTARNLVDDSFFVVNADDIFESSLIQQMQKQYEKTSAAIILACKRVKETWKFGIIELEDDRVIKIVEKPPKGQEPSNLAVVGAYVLPEEIFDYYERIPVSDHQFEDAVGMFIENGKFVSTVVYDGFFAGYKFPWDLFSINEYLMDKHLSNQRIEDNVDISEKATVKGNVWIRCGTKILDGAYVDGPCYIGINNLVGNNCLIRKYASLGDHCVVGFSTEIKHSLIGDHCWFHTNYVGDSIVGDRCSFGAGTITANFRFDEKPVKVNIEGRPMGSELDKFGAIVGDGCKTGINACLTPGVKIGPHSIVGPNVNLQEDLKPGKLVLIDKESYLVKENKISLSPEERRELKRRLMTYGQ